MNLIQFLNILKFFNTQKRCFNKKSLTHKIRKDKNILLKIRYTINNHIVEINSQYTKYR